MVFMEVRGLERFDGFTRSWAGWDFREGVLTIVEKMCCYICEQNESDEIFFKYTKILCYLGGSGTWKNAEKLKKVLAERKIKSCLSRNRNLICRIQGFLE